MCLSLKGMNIFIFLLCAESHSADWYHYSFAPRRSLESASDDAHTKLRKTIIQKMDEETLYSTTEHFTEHSLPPIPSTVNLEAIISHRTGSSKSIPVISVTRTPAILNDNPSPQRGFSPKKRCSFIFRDTCTRVSALATLGDAMDVLRIRQTHLNECISYPSMPNTLSG